MNRGKLPSVPDDRAILPALRRFADTVTAKMTTLTAGEPEDQLRGPFEVFMQEVGQALALKVVCAGEVRLPGRMGKPDYAVHAADLLAGYVELKAPGVGANPGRFTGHNAQQWKRFQAQPNLLYCDGNDWGLYRNGQAVRPVIRLSGDVATDGKKAVTEKDAQAVLGLLTDFLSWQPIIPKNVKDLAGLLAPLCRMLRDDVTDALKDPQSPLVQLAKDWRQLLFPDAGDEQFADAYAQTVTFALLLARSEGATPLDLASAEAALAAEHSLLSRALQVLTDPRAQAEISASLNLLIRVIGEVPAAAMTGPKDPWLYFYEDFMAAYDPDFRKKMGVYYTPVEVVRAQVRLIDDLLTNRLGKALGFADPGVVTLDPAVGTGTYLLGVIDHALGKVQAQQGAGAVPGQATALAGNIYGFEIMTGPYAVADLRISRALETKGANLPKDGIGVYLTDTLESPYVPPRDVPYILRPMADHHKKALKLKCDDPVLVCMGNPPYDRHEAADKDNKARTGGWVRWGNDSTGKQSILDEFLKPTIAAGHGVHVKNMYNLYVYFWRWALWKVFEWQKQGKDKHGNDIPLEQFIDRPGVVSFISASSYLVGDAFCGMREHMRRLCDEIWILDLGGEGRGTRKSENVFAIQTPVAIAVAVRGGLGLQPVNHGGGTGFQPVNHGHDAHATSRPPMNDGQDVHPAPIAVRQGAYLPHWTKGDSVYSVTFRLADCLPATVLDAWGRERENIIRTAEQMGRPLAEHEETRLQYLLSDKVDRYMDAGHGACWMKRCKIAGIVADGLSHFDGERYRLLAWCVMPNHVHVVVQPLPGYELADILHSWKSFTANQANKALGRKGDFWQAEYYDHLVRNESDLTHSIEYVMRNPEQAGLRNWQWRGGGTGFQPVNHGGGGGGTGFQPVNHGHDAHATSRPPAKVHYARITGTRDQKLKALDAVSDFASLAWQDCPDDWRAPFRPAGTGKYSTWPLLTDLLPWQHSGAQFKRTWPICPCPGALKSRWRALLASTDKADAFKETRDRKVSNVYPPLPGAQREKSIAQLPRNAPAPDTARYAYRSFDRQWILPDNRLGDFIRPDLWAAHGEGQVYLTSLLTKPLGTGPALTACALMPDLDHFSGRGAKDIAPLYRDAAGKETNILPGLLDALAKAYGRAVTPEDFLAYIYGALAHPAFTERFADELGTRELRVPLTKDAGLFAQVRDVGAKLLWLHTYGQRFVPRGKHKGQVPKGAARCVKGVPGDAANYPEKYEYNDATQTLHVGAGEFAPVAPEVYGFEVSGLKVVQSWLKYRMKKGGGKKSSPLDDIRPEKWTGEFTTELLELLWVLEATIAEYPAQAKLLSAVVAGPCFAADELPAVPDAARRPPARPLAKGLFHAGKDEGE